MLEVAENILPFVEKAGNRVTKPAVEDVPSVSIAEALADHLSACLPAPSHPLFAPANHHFQAPGKMLRSRVALAAGLQQGMSRMAALDWAIAIELMHNASLVHDDICDDDKQRRNRPSLWAAFGRATAICFGDWLIAKSFELAARVQSETDKPFTALLAKTMSDLSTGQAAEFSNGAVSNCETYLDVVAGKTTPLFMAAIEGPFLINETAETHDIVACRKIFEHIGFAYQIANDIDNHQMLKNGAETGDLLRGAPNAVYICYRSGLSDDRRALFDKWQNAETKPYRHSWLADITKSDAEAMASALFAEHLHKVTELQSELSLELARLVSPICAYLSGDK